MGHSRRLSPTFVIGDLIENPVSLIFVAAASHAAFSLFHAVIPDVCNRGSRVFIFLPGNPALS